MKIFFYKSLLVFFLFLVAFHFSFSYVIKKSKSEINNFISKDNLELLKNKIREEMKSATVKDDYINKEDAILLNKFLDKVKSDLKKYRIEN